MSHDGYQGAATILGLDTEVEAEATLVGHFEPIDGRYHWYGRLAPSPELDALVSGSVLVTLRTPYGSAEGRLGDADPWGRLRISGVSRPPFAVALALSDVEV